jgi:hypothetical protein
MVRRSYNAVVERNVAWSGAFSSEPYEAGWAGEALFFITALKGGCPGGQARVQISADGMRWVDEGTVMSLPVELGATTHCKVAHFGNWLRLAGEAAHSVTVLVTVSLKE